MGTVTSKDGTQLVYDRSGAGPALILVLGAFNERPTGAPLAGALAAHFTVYNYDRRGRGESGDTLPYAVEHEIEDLDALIAEAGGSATIFGYSSGAILALRAAAHGLPISKLVLYDPPPTGERAEAVLPQLSEHITAGRRGDAVELFQTDMVGIPPEIVVQLRHAPFRPALEKIAHTLVYESTILSALPAGALASVAVPTLVIDAERNPDVMHQSARFVVDTLPQAEYKLLEGQGHDIVPEVVAPVVQAFLLGA